LDDVDARAQAAKALAQLRSAEADLQAIQSGGTHEEVLTTQSELTKAQTERDEARRNLDAYQHLQQSGGASPAEVQAADERLKKAETNVQLLQAKLNTRFSSPEVAKVQAAEAQARAGYAAAQDLVNNSNIRSPRDGSVYQLPVKAGAYVGPGQLLV